MLIAFFMLPALAGLLALVIHSDALRRTLLLTVAGSHLALTATAWYKPPAYSPVEYLGLDPLGLLFLSILSILFFFSSIYANGYLKRESASYQPEIFEGTFFARSQEAVFTCCLMEFLATMSLVTLCQHFGLLWVAVEATTLVSAPLIYYHRNHRSLEATWKYLILCSVGIAIALLGNFFLAVAATGHGGHETPLVLRQLVLRAGQLHSQWLKGAFLLLLVGYGTKIGLAPMHSWLPDAHSESPSFVSMLLSGALLNCAFLGLLRIFQVCEAAGLGKFARDLLVLFGFVSLATAAVFIIRQTDYKRMLAYSSVEHMGILCLGVGFGGVGVFGALLHAVNHSLTKGMLFLVAGNLLSAYRTRNISEVKGVLNVLPVSGALWLAGFLAITGTPPFGLFISEFTILRSLVHAGSLTAAACFLLLLGIIFAGMANIMLNMAQGKSELEMSPALRVEAARSVIPPLCLGALTLILGLYHPALLVEKLRQAASLLGGF